MDETTGTTISHWLFDIGGWGNFLVRLVFVAGLMACWALIDSNVMGGRWSLALPSRQEMAMAAAEEAEDLAVAEAKDKMIQKLAKNMKGEGR